MASSRMHTGMTGAAPPQTPSSLPPVEDGEISPQSKNQSHCISNTHSNNSAGHNRQWDRRRGQDFRQRQHHQEQNQHQNRGQHHARDEYQSHKQNQNYRGQQRDQHQQQQINQYNGRREEGRRNDTRYPQQQHSNNRGLPSTNHHQPQRNQFHNQNSPYQHQRQQRSQERGPSTPRSLDGSNHHRYRSSPSSSSRSNTPGSFHRPSSSHSRGSRSASQGNTRSTTTSVKDLAKVGPLVPNLSADDAAGVVAAKKEVPRPPFSLQHRWVPSSSTSNKEHDAGIVVKKDAVVVAAKDAAKDSAKDVAKDVAKDIAKQVAKDAAKDAAKEVAKDAAKDAAASIPAVSFPTNGEQQSVISTAESLPTNDNVAIRGGILDKEATMGTGSKTIDSTKLNISSAQRPPPVACKPPPPPKRKVNDAISGWLTTQMSPKKTGSIKSVAPLSKEPTPPPIAKRVPRKGSIQPKKRKITVDSMEDFLFNNENTTKTAKAPRTEKGGYSSLEQSPTKKKSKSDENSEEKQVIMVPTPSAVLNQRKKKLTSASVVSDDVPTESSFLSSCSSSQMMMATSGSIVSLAEAATDEWSLPPSSVVVTGTAPVIAAAISVEDASSVNTRNNSSHTETPLGMKVNQGNGEVPQPRDMLKSTSTVADAMDSDSGSESDTDEEEVWRWAEKMLGVTPPGLLKLRQEQQAKLVAEEEAELQSDSSDEEDDDFVDEPAATTFRQKPMTKPKKQKKKQLKRAPAPIVKKMETSKLDKKKQRIEEKRRQVVEDDKRKKEEAKPLTAAQIREILGEDANAAPLSHWVRRSCRQPCKAALSTPGVRALLDKLRGNDSDMVVLKMKRYINDPDAPQVVIDAALDALEENTNCEALYIQNFNKGMHDEQVLHLLKILQLPTCKIWCLNIGETYNVKTKTWKKFAKGLKITKVTNMYASEHTIDGELKDSIRETIRANRSKHDMHNNPENLDVIVQCTHCWWNPMNAKSLRPYLRKKGLEHILLDKEAQGLRGSTSGAAGADSAVGAAAEEAKRALEAARG